MNEDDLISLAARVLRADRASLSAATSYGSIPEWDSVNHLRLVMEVESAFGVRYPLERIPRLKTLGDFMQGADRCAAGTDSL